MSRIVAVYTTTATAEEATKIAEVLVGQQLAACVQIDGPITSYYRWKGKVESSREWRLMIKTLASKIDELQSTVLKLHSYETPEIVSVPIDGGLPAYLQWLADSVQE